MRLFLRFAVISSALCAACQCSPPKPQSVTMRLKNTGRSAIYVDDTEGKLGLTVERKVNGQWYEFDDEPCSCLACENACQSSCGCDAGAATVRKVMPDTNFERSWNGIVQVSGTTRCTASGACLNSENAPLDEVFNVKLCYAASAPGLADLPDGGTTLGKLDVQNLTCVEQGFRPSDTVVEVGPLKGSACENQTQCPGMNELCLNGACTTGCPDNGFPTLGAGWSVHIASPDDQGFFTTSVDAGVTLYSGAGTLSSVVYQGTTLVLRLSRVDQGVPVLGAIYLTLPQGYAAPLSPGTSVSVKLFDASTADNRENRGLVVRDGSGVLLLAVDHAQQGPVLSAGELAPFQVDFLPEVVGCRFTECGKQLFFPTRFTAGSKTSSLKPGGSATVDTAQGAYRALNVSSASYNQTSCKLFDVRPWALWREQP